MATAVSQECFVPATRCSNCQRKSSNFYKKDNNVEPQFNVETGQAQAQSKGGGFSGNDVKGGKCKVNDKKGKMERKTKSQKHVTAGERKEYKRCTGCFMMAYCDESCQRQHWNYVHKYHCDYLSAKRVLPEHQEDSCEECVVKKTTRNDELLDIDSPKIGCRFKEESKRMRRELGDISGFHKDGHPCSCGNKFACEFPFPMGEIRGNRIATVVDEMIVHAAKICNALIIKSMTAKEKKDTIDRLLVLHKSILLSRVYVWDDILVYGDILDTKLIGDMLSISEHNIRDRLDNENPWWMSLQFSLHWISRVLMCQAYNMEMTKSPNSFNKLNEKTQFHKEQANNISLVSENNLWYRFKFWPTKMDNSLVLGLPDDVFCASCNADLGGSIVGAVDDWKPENPSASLFGGVVANNGGIAATCSPAQNLDCGKDYSAKLGAITRVTDEELEEYKVFLGNIRICHLCLKKSPSSHRCTKCLAAQYCSQDCALEDFAFHKTVCSTWARDPARKLMSGNKQKDVVKKIVQGNLDKYGDLGYFVN